MDDKEKMNSEEFEDTANESEESINENGEANRFQSVKKKNIFDNLKARIKIFAESFKKYYSNNRKKTIGIISAVLLVVIAAPIVITSLFRDSWQEYLLSIGTQQGGSVVLYENGKEAEGFAAVRAGAVIKVKAVAQEHYEFTGWYDHTGSDGKYTSAGKEFFENSASEIEHTFKMPKKDIILVAHFKLITHELTITAIGDGGVGINGGSIKWEYAAEEKKPYKKAFKEGAEIRLTATPNYLPGDDYNRFDGWYHGGKKLSEDATYTFDMPGESYSIEARFYRTLNGEEETSFDKSTNYAENEDYLFPVSGDGNSQTPFVYEISTKEQLALIAYLINTTGRYNQESEIFYTNIKEKFVLTKDINLEKALWAPMGTAEYPFKGVFDGNGYYISNFIVKGTDDEKTGNVYAGFFGYVDMAEISKLTISNAEISLSYKNANVYAGAVAGYCAGAKLYDIKILKTAIEITAKNACVGGAFGRAPTMISGGRLSSNGQISATVSAADGVLYIGNLIGASGDFTDGVLTDCSSDVKITKAAGKTVHKNERYGYIGGVGSL
ncbi:MAG: hypothetical protein LBQ27_02820 [Clostridiales bacterium]|jgi:hypothetical protein|nr:hypothetical protein [Clostridiales bacterium]